MNTTKLMVLLAIIFLGGMKVVAQERGNERMPYHTFLKEGKTWNFQYYYRNLRSGEEEEWTKDISYVVNGTTEIDGKTYYKMYRVSEEGSEYYCALREEDRKVWMRTDNGGERMLYDFGMSVGGCYMPYDEWNTLQLVAISPMRFKDEILNVFHYDVSVNYFFLESFEVFPYSVVEGVGCDKGWNILELFYSVPSNGIIMREDFLSCFEDGKCIYNVEWTGTPVETNDKCATPTIAYDNGRLLFDCGTEGAECVYEIKCADVGSGRGGEVALGQTYEIRVHATLDGWQDSDVAVATIGWRNGRPVMEGFSSVTMDAGDGNADVNRDGTVDVADIASVIAVMAGKTSE